MTCPKKSTFQIEIELRPGEPVGQRVIELTQQGRRMKPQSLRLAAPIPSRSPTSHPHSPPLSQAITIEIARTPLPYSRKNCQRAGRRTSHSLTQQGERINSHSPRLAAPLPSRSRITHIPLHFFPSLRPTFPHSVPSPTSHPSLQVLSSYHIPPIS